MSAAFRLITPRDYDELFALWSSIPGMGMRSLDDSCEGITKFLRRNPDTCFAAVDGKIIGCILCGNDGRRGYIYHTCVLPEYRGQGVGSELVRLCCEALKAEGIKKCALVCYSSNDLGNKFWQSKQWELRTDLTYYNMSLDENNI